MSVFDINKFKKVDWLFGTLQATHETSPSHSKNTEFRWLDLGVEWRAYG